MRVRCDRCGERFAIADIPVRSRPMKVRCRACRSVIEVGDGSPTVEPPPGSEPAPAGPGPQRLATSLPPPTEGSALIEIRQMAARTLAAHAPVREPSVRVAIQALLGSSRLATVFPMPPPARPPMPSWMVLLVVAGVSILGGTATLGALLYRYAGEAHLVSQPIGPFVASAAAAPLPVAPPPPAAAAAPIAPASPAAPLAAAPATTVAPVPATVVPAPAAPAPPTVAVRQHHRGGSSRRHVRAATRGHGAAKVAAATPRSRKSRTLGDDELDRILESTRFAAHGR